jgi:hypothetical protein
VIVAKCVSVSDGVAFGRLRGPAGGGFLASPAAPQRDRSAILRPSASRWTS